MKLQLTVACKQWSFLQRGSCWIWGWLWRDSVRTFRAPAPSKSPSVEKDTSSYRLPPLLIPPFTVILYSINHFNKGKSNLMIRTINFEARSIIIAVNVYLFEVFIRNSVLSHVRIIIESWKIIHLHVNVN